MNVTQAARRYADALLEAVGDAPLDRKTVREELSQLAGAFEASPDMHNLLANPAFSAAQREQVVKVLLSKAKVSERSQRFIELLVARGRVPELPAIVAAYGERVDAEAGVVDATVETAAALSASMQIKLKEALEARTGKTLRINFKLKPELIGGLRARVGNLVFDGSIQTEIAKLRESLQA